RTIYHAPGDTEGLAHHRRKSLDHDGTGDGENEHLAIAEKRRAAGISGLVIKPRGRFFEIGKEIADQFRRIGNGVGTVFYAAFDPAVTFFARQCVEQIDDGVACRIANYGVPHVVISDDGIDLAGLGIARLIFRWNDHALAPPANRLAK